MKRMLNILIITVILLVAIAAIAVKCHKEPEKGNIILSKVNEDGTITPICGYYDQKEDELRAIVKEYGVPPSEFNDPSKSDYRDYDEKRKELIEWMINSNPAFQGMTIEDMQDELNHKPNP